jgi:hypothetical protein
MRTWRGGTSWKLGTRRIVKRPQLLPVTLLSEFEVVLNVEAGGMCFLDSFAVLFKSMYGTLYF